MRRYPDFAGSAARLLLVAALPCLGAGALWLVQAGESNEGEGRHAPPPYVIATKHGALEARDFVLQPVSDEELVQSGRQWWETYVPDEIKTRYAFPSVEEIRGLLGRIEQELNDGSAAQLAAYERDARRALKTLHRVQGGELLAAWLEPRMDLLKAAGQIEAAPLPPWPVEAIPAPASVVLEVRPSPVAPVIEPPRPQFTRSYWSHVLLRRAPPSRATSYVPQLKEIFRAAGVPVELVWIAEVESAMNPEATSPAGARGLFQFMPMTAARFGLDAGLLVDERVDPEKSARAAAAYLRVLHRRFQSWPLAIAAYNAGEGRVGRALAAENAATFEAVAHRLPLETRMYVPKVLATVAIRESVDPETLPAPMAAESAQVQVVSDRGAVETTAPETPADTTNL